MVKLVNWETSWGNYSGKVLSLFNRVFIQTTTSVEFTIQGLGLSELERELFGNKKYSYNGRIQFYLPKLLITWNNKGGADEFKNVEVI